jgi:Animal haem peroxidase
MSEDSFHGLREPAGLSGVPHSRFHHGRFGRLFRNLPSAEHKDAALIALGEKMVDESEPPQGGGGWRTVPPDPNQGDNPDIPAGYTYLGQFIDHDITFDPASSLLRANDPDALHNFRTPRFDLDSVYGEGPDDEPFMYEQGQTRKFRLGRVGESDELDLPRNEEGRAVTGDPRNDENVIVSQLQLLFLRAHNKLAEVLGDFERAQRQLRWHYQWIVVHDFLERIVGKEVVDALLNPKEVILGPEEKASLPDPDFRFYGYFDQPFMPVEFSVAAYRFGHSMVRPRYDLNPQITDRPVFDPNGTPGGGQDLRGFQALLPGWSIHWPDFFKLGEEPVQASRLIDHKLAPALSSLPFAPDQPNLAARNLLRGKALGLPSGQAIARRIGTAPLTDEELGINALGLEGVEGVEQLQAETPLWFYVLREAELRRGGRKLGPCGAQIVAETLIGLLDADPFSYLNVEPGWEPKADGPIPKTGERFEMADLIRFVA